MDNEEIIEWLGRWGKDVVGFEQIVTCGFMDRYLMLNTESKFSVANMLYKWVEQGYLKIPAHSWSSYILTDKAIDKLKGNENG
jgi:hypothetical protein